MAQESKGNQPQVWAEAPQDVVPVHTLNESAFETSAEADVVDALRDQASPMISLVACETDTVVGHIMFSPKTLSGHSDAQIL